MSTHDSPNQEYWDRTCEILGKAIKLVPDIATYRKVLRGCQRQKYGQNKLGASDSNLRIDDIRLQIQTARKNQNWQAIDLLAEEGLAINPWDVQFNLDLGQAALELGFMEVSEFAFSTAAASTEGQ